METLYRISRRRDTKREVNSDKRWLEKHGGLDITVVGKRGGPWVIRAKISPPNLAKFCSVEAKRESKVPAN